MFNNLYSSKLLPNYSFIKKLLLVKGPSKTNKIKMTDWSGIAYIDIKENTSPFALTAEWFDEAKKYGNYKLVFNLATSTKSGEVSNRFLVLQDFVNDKFRFISNENSLKGQDMKENPMVAACFLLKYSKDGNHITRQLRCQGTITKMSYEEASDYYKKDPLYCQIRSHIYRQGEIVDWNEQKQKYDELVRRVEEGVTLTMPVYQTGYEISPFSFDFYDSAGDQIADRMVFKKNEENGCWDYHRVAA
ncbi:pyridoxine/pyridoxamine 5'-phosphate oxidase-like isoform X1 [Diorhabda carinulata]|uniref:pyridoxine/pyridoxamine 5'-phosphate oxidase-like isoform X1 n=2 Tax=Diorhabda carinulata TaxID=1163345 RepID=UPI0025A00EFD|nr:pyridoxine/pyridoxamine 5'-phosphate oxidase-like isoform X1 [Diorhabda carinulata]